MNDAERDAWLREALRHAPDSGALPPQDVSEAILAQARAAARNAQPLPAKAAPGATKNLLLAFWDWLARPPIAAGFASVMAATLVGVMWWDRPLDETLPRRPEVVSERAMAPAPSEAAAPAQGAMAPANNEESTSGTVGAAPGPPMRPDVGNATGALADSAPARRQAPSSRSAGARDGKLATAPAGEERKRADAGAKENVERADRTAAAPTPFPSSEDRRAGLARQPSVPAAKKDAAGLATPPSDAPVPADAAAGKPVAAEPATAPATPPATAKLRSQAEMVPAPTRRRSDDEQARASASNKVEMDVAKSAPAAVAPPPAAPTPAPSPELALRRGAFGEREKQASAFGASPAASAAPARSELAAAQREGAVRAAPLTGVLGDIATAPARWSRWDASGNAVALDAGWRDWLTELDAAAAGRWRQVRTVGADSERDGTATLRLVAAGRPPVVVRIDATTVRIDGPATGERWQATLPPPVAERLRASAGRLPP